MCCSFPPLLYASRLRSTAKQAYAVAHATSNRASSGRGMSSAPFLHESRRATGRSPRPIRDPELHIQVVTFRTGPVSSRTASWAASASQPSSLSYATSPPSSPLSGTMEDKYIPVCPPVNDVCPDIVPPLGALPRQPIIAQPVTEPRVVRGGTTRSPAQAFDPAPLCPGCERSPSRPRSSARPR